MSRVLDALAWLIVAVVVVGAAAGLLLVIWHVSGQMQATMALVLLFYWAVYRLLSR